MFTLRTNNIHKISKNLLNLDTEFEIVDHIGGFNQQLHNVILDKLEQQAAAAGIKILVNTHMHLHPEVLKLYPNLKITYAIHKNDPLQYLKTYYSSGPELQKFYLQFYGIQPCW